VYTFLKSDEMMDLRLKLRNLFFRLQNYLDNNNNSIIRNNGEFAFLANTMKRFRGDTFVLFDVGANVGDFSISAIQTFRQAHNNKNLVIHAFEPMPSTFESLRNAIADKPGCFAVNMGISENEGHADIFYDDDANKLASLYMRKELAPRSVTTIKLTRLDTYLELHNIAEIDLLKIDTEGHELSVLKSAGKYLHPETIRMIQFEYGGTYLDARIYLKDVYNLLEAKGYEIYKIYPGKLLRRTYHPVMENFQYANYVALGKHVHHD
jgi:FkbM family methyltransferase